MVGKTRGANMARKLIRQKMLRGPIKPAERIHDWNIFLGDRVMIVDGPERGQVGEVIDVNKRTNQIWVKGRNMGIKHYKPEPYRAGLKLSKEMPLNYKAVKHVEPLDETQTTNVTWETQVEPNGRQRRIRRSDQGQILKIQELDRGHPKEEGPLDTPSDLVSQVTFKPDFYTLPFPNMWWNELHRARRRNQEGMAL